MFFCGCRMISKVYTNNKNLMPLFGVMRFFDEDPGFDSTAPVLRLVQTGVRGRIRVYSAASYRDTEGYT